MERIVAAVDGSASSVKAVDLAAGLASKYDAELILFTVAREFPPVIDAELEAYARLEHIETLASEIGVAASETVLSPPTSLPSPARATRASRSCGPSCGAAAASRRRNRWMRSGPMRAISSPGCPFPCGVWNSIPTPSR